MQLLIYSCGVCSASLHITLWFVDLGREWYLIEMWDRVRSGSSYFFIFLSSKETCGFFQRFQEVLENGGIQGDRLSSKNMRTQLNLGLHEHSMQLWHFLKFSWKPFEEAFSKNRFQSSSLESGSMALSHIMSWPLPPPFLTQQPGEGWFRGEGFTTANTHSVLLITSGTGSQSSCSILFRNAHASSRKAEGLLLFIVRTS